MALLLYGFSCGLLGGVPLMFLWIFHLGYYHVIFLYFCSLFRCGIGSQNGKVVNVVHGHLPGALFQLRLDGGLEYVGHLAPSMRVGGRGS
jgi:hypothetical protein